MQHTPLVSVVIPTYNRASDLEHALKSVQAQTCTNWEAIIIDNHSVDNTDEVVSGFNDPRMKLLKIHNNGLIAASRNLGIHEASGEYIAFLDSDDWWKPEKLRLSLDALNAGADIVYHDLFSVRSRSGKSWFWKRPHSRQLSQPVFGDLLYFGNPIFNSSVVVKRVLMNKICGFSEDPLLIAAEDYGAWLNLAKKTEKFVRLDNPLGYYRVGGGNTSSPRLTIASNTRLIELYAKELRKYSYMSLPGWIAYSLARAYYLTGEFKKALYYSTLAISSPNHYSVKVKAIITAVFSVLRMMRSSKK